MNPREPASLAAEGCAFVPEKKPNELKVEASAGRPSMALLPSENRALETLVLLSLVVDRARTGSGRVSVYADSQACDRAEGSRCSLSAGE